MAMTVTNFDDPYLNLSASGSLNLATVAEYYPLEKGTELGGEMKLDLRIAGKVIDPKTMQASGSMTFLDVSAKTATSAKPVRKLNGTVTFNNEIAETKKLSLVIGRIGHDAGMQGEELPVAGFQRQKGPAIDSHHDAPIEPHIYPRPHE